MNEEDIDYLKAEGYCNSILKNCPGSVYYVCQRILYLLKSNQLKEADKFSSEVVKRSEISSDPRINSWRVRVVIYAGNDILGKKLLM